MVSYSIFRTANPFISLHLGARSDAFQTTYSIVGQLPGALSEGQYLNLRLDKFPEEWVAGAKLAGKVRLPSPRLQPWALQTISTPRSLEEGSEPGDARTMDGKSVAGIRILLLPVRP